MFLTKLTEKSLVTTQDIAFNYRLGIPVEVFCSHEGKTVAFGQISSFNDQVIYIRGNSFSRSNYLFFGQPALSASS